MLTTYHWCACEDTHLCADVQCVHRLCNYVNSLAGVCLHTAW